MQEAHRVAGAGQVAQLAAEKEEEKEELREARREAQEARREAQRLATQAQGLATELKEETVKRVIAEEEVKRVAFVGVGPSQSTPPPPAPGDARACAHEKAIREWLHEARVDAEVHTLRLPTDACPHAEPPPPGTPQGAPQGGLGWMASQAAVAAANRLVLRYSEGATAVFTTLPSPPPDSADPTLAAT